MYEKIAAKKNEGYFCIIHLLFVVRKKEKMSSSVNFSFVERLGVW